MYNLNYNRAPSGTSGNCKPDYEEQYRKDLRKYNNIKNFRNNLRQFVASMPSYSFKPEDLALFLGGIEVDLIYRYIDLKRLEDKIK